MKRHLKYFALLAALLYPSMVEAKPRKARRAKTAIKKRIVAAKKIKITPAMLRGKIVFMQDFDLWAMKSDGSGRIKILSKPFGGSFSNDRIAFSPDLSRLLLIYDPPNDDAYLSDELFIMRLNGTQKRQLTNRKYSDAVGTPSFSPDGRHILYTRGSGKHWGGPMNASAEVWVINADGSGHHRVVSDHEERAATQSGARWSRDGKRIFYLRTEGSIPESPEGPPPVFTPWSVALDGSDARPVEKNWADFALPEVSPDGHWRVVDSQWDEEKSEYTPLMLHDLQNGGTQPLTSDSKTQYGNAHWSADSQSIVFEWSLTTTDNGYHQERGIDIIKLNDGQSKHLSNDCFLITWLP